MPKPTTTLNLIRAASPCREGYAKLLRYLGKTEPDDAPIDLLTVLESNGLDDALWCLRATVEDSRRLSVRLAIAFAEQVLPIFESARPGDDRPRRALQAARDYLDGSSTGDAAAYASAHAWAAADDAGNAARSAYAARSVAAYAAYAAYAARSVADAAQTEIFRSTVSEELQK